MKWIQLCLGCRWPEPWEEGRVHAWEFLLCFCSRVNRQLFGVVSFMSYYTLDQKQFHVEDCDTKPRIRRWKFGQLHCISGRQIHI